MNKFTHLLRFVQYLFDDKDTARKAKMIIEGHLESAFATIKRHRTGDAGERRSELQVYPTFSSPAVHRSRHYCACSKKSAPFVIGDPTEMPRPQAKKSGYVGTLSDGKDQRVLVVDPGDTFSWTSDPLSFRELLIQDHQ